MKIGLIAPMPFPAVKAASIRVKNIADLLVKHGNGLHVFSYPPGDAEEEVDGIMVHRATKKISGDYYSAKTRLAMDLQLTKKILKLVNKGKIDILHCHLHEGAGIGCLVKLLSFSKIPIIADIHGPFLPELIYTGVISPNNRFKFLFRFIEKTINKLSDKIIVTSTGLKKLISSTGISKDKINVISDYVVLNNFSSDIYDAFLIEKYKLHNKKIVMYVGMLKEYQGIEYLLKSFLKIEKKCPDAVLVIVGNTRCEEYKEVTNKMDLKNVIYTGFQPHVTIQNYLSIADVVVSSRIDTDVTKGGFVSQLPEYMAMGKAIVATNVSDCDLMLQNDSGILVKERNTEEMADAVIKLLKQPGLREKIGNNAKNRAKIFSWENQFENLNKVYESVLSD